LNVVGTYFAEVKDKRFRGRIHLSSLHKELKAIRSYSRSWCSLFSTPMKRPVRLAEQGNAMDDLLGKMTDVGNLSENSYGFGLYG
jgi:hypothetical protein